MLLRPGFALPLSWFGSTLDTGERDLAQRMERLVSDGKYAGFESMHID